MFRPLISRTALDRPGLTFSLRDCFIFRSILNHVCSRFGLRMAGSLEVEGVKKGAGDPHAMFRSMRAVRIQGMMKDKAGREREESGTRRCGG